MFARTLLSFETLIFLPRLEITQTFGKIKQIKFGLILPRSVTVGIRLKKLHFFEYVVFCQLSVPSFHLFKFGLKLLNHSVLQLSGLDPLCLRLVFTCPDLGQLSVEVADLLLGHVELVHQGQILLLQLSDILREAKKSSVPCAQDFSSADFKQKLITKRISTRQIKTLLDKPDFSAIRFHSSSL